MLKLNQDLQVNIIRQVLDNRKNLITASVVRGILRDVVDSALEPQGILRVGTVPEFLEFIDAAYFQLRTKLEKDPGFKAAFTAKQYWVYIDNDNGLAPTIVTPLNRTVEVDLQGHTPAGGGVYLGNDTATGDWKVVFALDDGRYTNPEEVPVDIGGIEAGTTFDNVAVQDVLTQLLYPYKLPMITMSGNIASTTLEVGTSLLAPNTPITLTYSGEFLQNVESGVFLQDGVVISPPTPPNTPFTYTLPSYATLPNIATVPATGRWGVRVQSTRGSVIEDNFIQVNWVHRMFVGWSTEVVTDYNLITLTQTSLTRVSEAYKPDTAEEAYLYIFQPTSYEPYNRFLVNGLDAVMAPVQLTTLVRFGVAVQYRIYRLYYSTFGGVLVRLT